MDKVFSLIKINPYLLIIVLLNLIKLPNLNSGLVLGEPDEWNHLEVSRNFSQSIFPNYSGVPFYYSLPFYPFLGYLLNFFVSDRFLSLRVISLISSILISLAIYFYLEKKISQWAGFLASVIFVLTPLSLFYSRIGLIEMTLSSLIFLSIIIFEKISREDRSKSLLSGSLMGLAILTKYTALVFVIVAVTFFALTRFNKFKNLVKKKYFDLFAELRPLLCYLLTAILVVSPVILLFIAYDRHEFKVQTEYIFSLKEGSGVFFFDYLINSIKFFSPSVLISFIIGLVWIFYHKKWREFSLIILALIVYFFFIGKRDVTPRYLVVMLPYLCVIAGLGAFWLSKVVKNNLTAGFILVISFLPFINEPINASNHNLAEEAGSYVKEINKDNQWVLTNFWPSAFVDETGYKITWLSASTSDSQAFSSFPSSKYKKIDKSSYEVLIKEGGIVILEDLYSKTLHNLSRKMPIESVKNNYEPVKVFEDHHSNWPFFN